VGVKCAFITDDDGSRTLDIFGRTRAVKFFEDSRMAEKNFLLLMEKV